MIQVSAENGGNERSHLELPSILRPRIILVGVGHIFDLREKIKGIIRTERPQIVALELDSARFYSLLSKEKRTGDAPFLYQLLGRFQSDLAEQFGGEIGSEMIAAADAAKETGANIALIDMDAANMFQRLRQAMSFKEKILMTVGVVLAFFTRKSSIEKEMDRYSKDEEKFMNDIQKTYPSVMRVLIEERNSFMAQKLKEISTQSNVIVAVIGDGHVPGMKSLLSEFADVEAWRLEELRNSKEWAENREMTVSFTLSPPDSKI